MTAAVTVLRAAKPAHKIVFREDDGSVGTRYAKDGGVYKARHVELGCGGRDAVEDLAHLITEVGSDTALLLTLGVFPDRPADEFTILPRRVIAGALGVPKTSDRVLGFHQDVAGYAGPVVARLKANMAPGGGVVFDFDRPVGTPDAIRALTAEQWVEHALAPLWPGLADAGHVIVPSTKGRIIDQGKRHPAGGVHLYAIVDDPMEATFRVWPQLLVKAFSTLLPDGTPLGFMRPKFSRKTPGVVVAKQAWAAHDPSTIGRERLVFEGAPHPIAKGIKIAPPDVRWKPGPALRCADFADVTSDQAKPAARSGVRVKRERVKSKDATGATRLVVEFQVDTQSLTLECDLEREDGTCTTLREWWLAGDVDDRRFQSPFRESTSTAAFCNVHSDGVPFLYDSGTDTKYLLLPDELLRLGVDDFLDALKAWLATAGEKLEGEQVKGAMHRASNVISAAARHEYGKPEYAALCGQLADLLHEPMGQPRRKLANTLEGCFRDLFKSAAKSANRAAMQAEGTGDTGQAEMLREMNDRYAVLRFGNKVVIAEPDKIDPCLQRKFLGVMSRADFCTALENREVTIRTLDGDVEVPLAAWWLRHPKRRQYLGGVTCDPSGEADPDEFLNLWRGFAVEPAEGDCGVFLRHLDLVAMGNGEGAREYLKDWLAWKLQNPGQQPEVATVLRGDEGTGKGAVGKIMMTIFGPHAVYVAQSSHLVGKFNNHLMDALFLFADEALFAGDRAHVGVLKSLITEPMLMIEPKGVNSFQMRNRLGVLMATNEDWAVPASADARRYFVLNMPDNRKGDHRYFTKLFGAIDDPVQLGAFLHHLLTRDLSKFNIRDVPNTKALGEQKLQSLGMFERWLFDGLDLGNLAAYDPATVAAAPHGSDWNGQALPWVRWNSTNLLHDSYLAYCRERMSSKFTESREAFGRKLARFYTPKRGTNGSRLPGYWFGTLDEARARFEEVAGVADSVVWADLQPYDDDGPDPGEAPDQTIINLSNAAQRSREQLHGRRGGR